MKLQPNQELFSVSVTYDILFSEKSLLKSREILLKNNLHVFHKDCTVTFIKHSILGEVFHCDITKQVNNSVANWLSPVICHLQKCLAQ
jgi:hypothetical protein